ncbi:MAG: diacylglycerol kinase, partial [Gammaproteobacteria bacterium]|nr:diacylglycerol kinase [Gammaproteobacteria bacterium]
MEAWLAACLCPFAFVLGTTRLEIGFLFATLLLVLIVELLNTGIESAIDRMGYE